MVMRLLNAAPICNAMLQAYATVVARLSCVVRKRKKPSPLRGRVGWGCSNVGRQTTDPDRAQASAPPDRSGETPVNSAARQTVRRSIHPSVRDRRVRRRLRLPTPEAGHRTRRRSTLRKPDRREPHPDHRSARLPRRPLLEPRCAREHRRGAAAHSRGNRVGEESPLTSGGRAPGGALPTPTPPRRGGDLRSWVCGP